MGKCVSLKGYLACHMKIQTGEKPFTCDACWKRTRTFWSGKKSLKGPEMVDSASVSE